MNEEIITKELTRFNVTDSAIAELGNKYLTLTLKNAKDKDGYEKVHPARMEMVKRRTSVETMRKELKADSLKFGRAIDEEARRITELMKPIEDHLTEQEEIYTDEIARLKTEAEAKEAARIQARVDRICAFGATYNCQVYAAYGLKLPYALLKVCTDGQFEQFVGQIQELKDAEEAKIKAVEDARRAEDERLAKVAAEQETERKRLAAEAKRQAEETARIKAEQDLIAVKLRFDREAIEKAKQGLIDAEAARLQAIEDEKKRAENEKRRAAELEQARKQAAEKAVKDAIEKAEREAAAKIERERKALEAAERKAARAPDKVKLSLLADTFAAVRFPDLRTAEAKEILIEIEERIDMLLKMIRDKVEEL